MKTVYDIKTKEWCSVEKTIVFDSVGYLLDPPNGETYCLTEQEFERRCIQQREIQSKKERLAVEINNTTYGIIKYLCRKHKDFGKLKRSIDLLQTLQEKYDALPS